MSEDWMISTAYSIAAQLPSNPKEAFVVLALAREIVEKVSIPYLRRSGAFSKARARTGSIVSRRPK
jgi:hypothetical protein